MKRTLRLVGVAAMVLLLAASCKKDEKNNGETQRMTFTAGIEQGNSKTGLTPNGSHAFNQVWSEGDAINVNGTTFGLKNGANTDCAEFDGEVIPAETYYAVYPATATLNSSEVTFNLPASQTYLENSYASNLAPMAAKSTDENLSFANLCGLMELGLVGENITVTSLELSCDKPICGQTAEYTIGGDAALAMPAEAGKTITMNCVTTAYPNGVALNGTTPTSFIFVLPPVTEGDFTLTVTYSGGTQTKTLPENISIGAGKVAYNNTPYKIEAGSSAPEGFVDFGTHVNGFGGTEPLYWAKCNVGANGNVTNGGGYYMWGHVENCSNLYCQWQCGLEDHAYTDYRFVVVPTDGNNLTKYCFNPIKGFGYNPSQGIEGFTDDKGTLESSDDAATHANSKDRMPSNAEWEELIGLSYRETVTSYNGVSVNGCIIYKAKDVNHRGKKDTLPLGTYTLDDTHIFLPAGYRSKDVNQSQGIYYWSRTLDLTTNGGSTSAYLYDNGNGVVSFGRFYGFRVRPVREQNPND